MRGMATYCALRYLVWHLPFVVSPSFDGCKRTVHRCSFCDCLNVLQGFQQSIVLMLLYLWYHPEIGILESDFCFARFPLLGNPSLPSFDDVNLTDLAWLLGCS